MAGDAKDRAMNEAKMRPLGFEGPLNPTGAV